MALHPYVPQDRLRALTRGVDLPERCQGTALFADIAGFTHLTESLTRDLGERRGVEALSGRISAVYDALIAEIEREQGSVIGFAGDAITCWFDADLDAIGANDAEGAEGAGEPAAAARAARAAQGMQQAMRGVTDLSVKVALTSGSARRFAVGDPQLHRIDVLAGRTLDRMAAAEHLARPGEVVVDGATAARLGLNALPPVAGSPGEGPEAVLRLPLPWQPAVPGLGVSPPPPVPVCPLPPAETLRPWVLPFVQEREDGWSALFATDLRPVAVLFVRFGGLDYDADPSAAERLDALIVRAQHLLQRHEGVLLELTVGDKGSYFLAGFGAARVHEDDPSRAVRAALDLRSSLADTPLQIGVSYGTLRVGRYGSRSRCSFGAMGDVTNAAARLMGLAQPGEILVSARLRQAVAASFVLEARPPIPLKGKAEPMPVFAVLEALRPRTVQLQERGLALPLVGRDAERERIAQALREAAQGRGQLLCVGGEAGMGKSRLVAEAVQLARREGFRSFGGSCASDGLERPYRVWQDLLLAFFELDPTLPQRRCVRQLVGELEDHAPEHAEAWPVLEAVLGLNLPDNALTGALQAKDRKALLETVLVRCLAGRAREATRGGAGGGLLLVLEDLHAVDPLSLDLLLQVARELPGLPLLVLTTHRTEAAQQSPQLQPLHALPHAQRMDLGPLGAEAIEQVIRAKLTHLFPARLQNIPPALIKRVSQRAQGNPFYAEELLNYLHDRGLDPLNLATIAHLEFPASLHSLVLSRIDRLGRSQQLTLKVASIVGRSFRAAELPAYYPPLGEPAAVREDLAQLDPLGFIQPDPSARELSYQFRQLVTWEVDYESIPHATRVELHAGYARYLETQHAGQLEQVAALLAHHHARAEQRDQAWPHLIEAGKQAAERYANYEALRAFESALAWMPAGETAIRFDLLLRREALLDLLGRHDAQQRDLAELAPLAERLPASAVRRATVATRQAKLAIDLGDFAGAQAHCARALQVLQAEPGVAGGAQLRVEALQLQARARFNAGDSAAARALLEEALLLARHHGDRRGHYNTLAQLGVLHWQQGEHDAAERLMGEALPLIREAGDLRREIDLLNNLGVVAKTRGRFEAAIARYEEAQGLSRRIGDRSGEASLISNIASACLAAGDFEGALVQAERAVQQFAVLNEPAQHAMAMVNQAEALRELGQPLAALPLARSALAAFRGCGHRRGEAILLENLGLLESALGHRDAAEGSLRAAVALAQEIGLRTMQATAPLHHGALLAGCGERPAACAVLDAAEPLVRALDDPLPGLEWRALRASLIDDPAEALALVEPLLAVLLDADTAAVPYLPLRLHARALQVLRAAGDARASALHAKARAELQARSQRIQRAPLRQDFLALPEHRALQEA